MISMLLIGPLPIFLKGLEKTLLSCRQDLHISISTDFKSLGSSLEKNTPNLLLADLSLENPTSKKNFKQLIIPYPGIQVIVLSHDDRLKVFRNWFKAGILAYAYPTLSEEELLEAFDKVLAGERFLQAKLLAKVSDDIFCAGTKQNCFSNLTPRELEVIGLIINECTTKEIAAKLFISPCTAETHRLNIIQKLGVRNTAGIVREAFLNDLYV